MDGFDFIQNLVVKAFGESGWPNDDGEAEIYINGHTIKFVKCVTKRHTYIMPDGDLLEPRGYNPRPRLIIIVDGKIFELAGDFNCIRRIGYDISVATGIKLL